MSKAKYEVKATSKHNPNRVISQQLISPEQKERWIRLLKANGWRVVKEKAAS